MGIIALGKRYWPLVCLVLIALLAALALSYGQNSSFMPFFMGFFLCQFAMLKIFHPSHFVEGFQKYDLLAKRSKTYAYIYPLIELGLGLAYLSSFLPILTYVITIIVMGFSAIGVIIALKKGLDLKCACMGTILDVPLSTVTLVENLGMLGMAFFMLIFL